MDLLICQGCGYPLRPVADGFVIDLAGDRLDAIRPDMWGLPRLDGRIYCPPNSYALEVGPHVPTPPHRSEKPLVSKTHQLAADSWRVIGHLYDPCLSSPYARRRDPSMATVCKKQDAVRESVIDVVDRGLVCARLDGNELPLDGVRRLPEKVIRLRITKAGIYHASHDPTHLVMCALRTYPFLTLHRLLRGLVNPVGFGELCELADRHLFDTYLLGTDTEIPIRQMRDMPSFAYARQTPVGRAYAANP